MAPVKLPIRETDMVVVVVERKNNKGRYAQPTKLLKKAIIISPGDHHCLLFWQFLNFDKN